MNWKSLKKIFPVIGVGIFIYLLVKLDVTKVLNQISSLNFFYLFIAIIFVGFFFILQTSKWFIIARKQKIKIPFKDAFKINLISDFYGFVTPAKIGGVMRADYIDKYEGGKDKGLGNFAIDKILDLISLFFITIFFGFVFYQTKILSSNHLFLIIGIFLILMISCFIFYKEKNSRFLIKLVCRKFVPNKIKERAKTAFDSFYENIPSLKILFFVFLINLISWGVNYSILYFVGLSLGININFLIFLSIMPISTLIAQIPITINGFGTREVTMISLFGLFGVAAIKVFSMSILGIIIVNIIPAIFAVIFILLERKNEVYNIKRSR